MTFLSAHSHEQLSRYATQAAMSVASILFIFKFIIWLYTGSQAIKLSWLDSGFDLVVSTTNFIIIACVLHRKTDKFLYGFDKITAFATLSQSLLMFCTVAYTLLVSLSFDVPSTSPLSLLVLAISLLLSVALISFQQKICNLTHSLMIQADMLHYQTDLFMNSAAIVCLLVSWYWGISWLDPLIAIVIGLYLMRTILKLAIESLKILLDYKRCSKQYLQLLKSYNITKIDVIFSGMREIITIYTSSQLPYHEIKSIIDRHSKFNTLVTLQVQR